ncbi:MAG: DUF177 domain-containing protein [Deltaproteobacteria bacterium]|nr:DUF177 domain-containing protein [Deltaproteobacteria bacterium]
MDWCGERAGDLYTAKQDQAPVAITASKVAEVVHVQVIAHGRFGFVCSRCAEPAELDVCAAFDHHFVGPGKLDAGDGDAATRFDADPDVSEHDGLRAELDELVIEYLLLELPSAPLCAEDCKGLCPTCGANRNESTCGCPAQPDTLSPWAQLAQFQVRQAPTARP